MSRIHQLLPVLSPGDAVGQSVLRIQEGLHRLRVGGGIYAELVDESLQHLAQPANLLLGDMDDGDVVLYHLSIGARCADLVALLPRHALLYHNITPRRFYEDVNPRVAYWVERGRDDLARLAPLAELGLAASQFNENELRSAGCRKTMVVPPPVDLQRLRPRPAVPATPPRLLFVSRLAPNKRHDDLLRVLAALRAGPQPQARLVIPGGSDDTIPYVAALRELATRLGVAGVVEMPARRLCDREIGDLYATASVVVCMSEHEGFGMPLVEAMAFSVPVVAQDAGAVAETVGGAGIVLGHRDPLVWAEVIDRVIRDQNLRRELIGRGRRRLAEFSDDRVDKRLGEAVSLLGMPE